MCVPEVLDCSTSSSLELNDGVALVGGLGVDDDLKLEALGVHDALERLEVDPQIVGVEDLELAN